jgi:MFS family permease
MSFFNVGARFSFGVMFKPMLTELGWNRGTLSFVLFLNMAVFALSLAVLGRLYDHYGPRWLIVLSTILLSAGYARSSCTESLW